MWYNKVEVEYGVTYEDLGYDSIIFIYVGNFHLFIIIIPSLPLSPIILNHYFYCYFNYYLNYYRSYFMNFDRY